MLLWVGGFWAVYVILMVLNKLYIYIYMYIYIYIYILFCFIKVRFCFNVA